jgi:hypothetical protein
MQKIESKYINLRTRIKRLVRCTDGLIGITSNNYARSC